MGHQTETSNGPKTIRRNAKKQIAKALKAVTASNVTVYSLEDYFRGSAWQGTPEKFREVILAEMSDKSRLTFLPALNEYRLRVHSNLWYVWSVQTEVGS